MSERYTGRFESSSGSHYLDRDGIAVGEWDVWEPGGPTVSDLAAALNAAEHNAKRDELLREAEFFIRTVATDWTTIDEVNEDEAIEEPGCGFCEEPHGHTEDCTAAAWLARFAALEKEGKGGL